MALLNIFTTPRIRRFEYKPVYWDPAKEQREERLERVKHELGITEESNVYKPAIRRGVFREQRKTLLHERQNRIIWISFIVLILVALLYLMF